jgi:hypothetical protein
MRTRTLLASIALSALTAGSAQAATIAGWDFSQYLSGGGFLSIDGATLTNALSANYSNLDPTFNAGAESAAFGTMHIDGLFGSTNITPVGDGSEAFLPIAGSLNSNLTAPVQGFGDNPFDSLTILAAEGQQFQELLSMSVFGPVSVVFEADLTSVPEIGSAWSISFGGITLGVGQNAAVTIEFSTDGSNYVGFGSVNLTNVDTAFNVNLGAAESDRAFVRLGFASGAAQPLIDNVAIGATVTIPAPEPASAALLLAGLLGLAWAGRRRA